MPIAKKKQATALPVEQITQSILILRGQRVLLDSDLAGLYGVTTKRFNEQVKRNLDRFPADFMFQITAEELSGLRSQFATSKPGRGGRRYAPYVFTEHGTIMAAMILNSPRAVEMSVYVVCCRHQRRYGCATLQGTGHLARSLAGFAG